MAVLDMVRANRDTIEFLARRHGARNVRIFGSAARGDDREDSDIDFLVVMDPERSLFDQAAFLVDLEELLGRDVDVVTERALKARIRARVLAEAVPI